MWEYKNESHRKLQLVANLLRVNNGRVRRKRKEGRLCVVAVSYMMPLMRAAEGRKEGRKEREEEEEEGRSLGRSIGPSVGRSVGC